MAKSILDFMNPEERERALEKAAKRASRVSKGSVPHEIYSLCEFGYYFGWDAIKDVRDNLIDIDEMHVLLEGARKVWYAKLVEMGGVQVASSSFRSNSKSFSDAMRPFIERAE